MITLRGIAAKTLNPGYWALKFHRVSRWLYLNNMELLAETIWLSSRWICGVDIHPLAQVGHNIKMPHPFNIIIGCYSRIGNEVTILQGVTIGTKNILKREMYSSNNLPTIGNKVILGAGCKVLGGIKIGDRAIIGANSVVIDDVACGQTVAGMPAKTLESKV